MNNSNWHIEDFDLKLVKQIAEEFSLPQSIAKIMSLRGIIDRDISSNFFYPNKQKLHNPYLLKDMDKAVDALIKHINEKKKIMIYGDYDVDGVSSTSMLYNFFKSIDLDVSYYIPHRDIDGYGLSNRGIDFAKSIGASLIITCDCGINAFSQIEYAKNIEINVIVTDHHKPEDSIPECLAVVNPNRTDCSYPFKGLCGAGVAFKLAIAIADKLSIDLEKVWKYADLVTLGIAADIVPMIDENRIISHFGLQQIRQGDNLGVRLLIESSKINIDKIGIGQITFWVTPKINAAGRLGDAARAVKLLTTNNPIKAGEISNDLNKENEKRILKNSPKVATYDLKPEMSAYEITDELITEIENQTNDFICLNYANGDMVGHTGSFEAAIKACETIDECVEKVVNSCVKNHYTVLLISDHGNCDMMINEDGTPNTAHTKNLVPLILINSGYKSISDGILSNIAPTILKIMDIKIPSEMTEKPLV